MEKLWYYGKKLYYNGENYWTSIYKSKNIVDYQNLRNLIWFTMEKYMVKYKKYFKISDKFIA